MPISVKCTRCGSVLRGTDAQAGQKARCPKCQARVNIPAEVYNLRAEEPDVVSTPRKPDERSAPQTVGPPRPVSKRNLQKAPTKNEAQGKLTVGGMGVLGTVLVAGVVVGVVVFCGRKAEQPAPQELVLSPPPTSETPVPAVRSPRAVVPQPVPAATPAAVPVVRNGKAPARTEGQPVFVFDGRGRIVSKVERFAR